VLLCHVTKHLIHLRRLDSEQFDANGAIQIEDGENVAAVDLNHFPKQRRGLYIKWNKANRKKQNVTLHNQTS